MSTVSRRGFLGLLAGVTAAIAIPELLIPKRTYFLPPRGGWNGWPRYSEGWARPDPAMFGLIEQIERDVERLTGLPPIPTLPGYRLEWVAGKNLPKKFALVQHEGNVLMRVDMHYPGRGWVPVDPSEVHL